jgi:hypothetical protein
VNGAVRLFRFRVGLDRTRRRRSLRVAARPRRCSRIARIGPRRSGRGSGRTVQRPRCARTGSAKQVRGSVQARGVARRSCPGPLRPRSVQRCPRRRPLRARTEPGVPEVAQAGYGLPRHGYRLPLGLYELAEVRGRLGQRLYEASSVLSAPVPLQAADSLRTTNHSPSIPLRVAPCYANCNAGTPLTEGGKRDQERAAATRRG